MKMSEDIKLNEAVCEVDAFEENFEYNCKYFVLAVFCSKHK